MAIDLASVQQRVRNSCMEFTSVSDVLGFSDALNTSAIAPAAFVCLSSDQAEPNTRTTGVRRQRVNCTVSVIFCLKFGAVSLARRITNASFVAGSFFRSSARV